jgi:hypothetical protein
MRLCACEVVVMTTKMYGADIIDISHPPDLICPTHLTFHCEMHFELLELPSRFGL